MTVDDEDLARQVIREMLEPHEEIEIAGECANGFEAVKQIRGECGPTQVADAGVSLATGYGGALSELHA